MIDIKNNTLVAGLLWTFFGFGRYRTNGCVFRVPMGSMPLRGRAFYWFDSYENEERTLVKQFVRESDAVLEFGGGVGVVACIIDRILNNSGKHVVVESNVATLQYLKENRDRNNCSFRVVHGALSKDRWARLDFSQCFLTSCLGTVGESVIGFRLDECLQWDQFNCLVLDIEGAEVELLDYLPIVSDRIRLIIMEMHPNILGVDVCERIKNDLVLCGFKIGSAIGDCYAFLNTRYGAPTE